MVWQVNAKLTSVGEESDSSLSVLAERAVAALPAANTAGLPFIRPATHLEFRRDGSQLVVPESRVIGVEVKRG